jgi:hypothetical protein
VKKFLIVKRNAFFMTFLALAVVGVAILGGAPTAHNQESVLYNDDIAYAESNTSVSASSGTISGSQVSFGLAGASASSTSVQNGPAVSGVDYQDYAYTIASDLANGAASSSTLTVNTSGYSLPLQYDAYLPASISAVWNGSNVYADTYWSGTVLARAGFNSDNPDIDMSSASVSFGYSSSEDFSGGDGGGGPRDIQPVSFRSNGVYFLPAAFTGTKDKSYKINVKKWDAGETSFSSGKVKKWKSDIPNTENLDEVGVSIEMTDVQFDAASGTLNVKQKVRIKKVKKAKTTKGSAVVVV